jgi:hypothetical protein
MYWSKVFSARFRYSDGQFDFEMGWFWVAVCAGLIWWVF